MHEINHTRTAISSKSTGQNHSPFFQKKKEKKNPNRSGGEQDLYVLLLAANLGGRRRRRSVVVSHSPPPPVAVAQVGLQAELLAAGQLRQKLLERRRRPSTLRSHHPILHISLQFGLLFLSPSPRTSIFVRGFPFFIERRAQLSQTVRTRVKNGDE